MGAADFVKCMHRGDYDTGFSIEDTGFSIEDTGFSIEDKRSSIEDKGFSLDMKIKSMRLTGLEIVKWILVVLIVVFLVHSFTGNRISKADFDTVWDAVTADADMSKMQEGSNQMIRRLYGLDPARFDGIRLYYPKTNMGAEEILLVRLKDTGDQEMVRSAMESRKKTQMNNFNGYGTYQYAMLEKSIISIRGNYALFVSADKAGEIGQEFENAL